MKHLVIFDCDGVLLDTEKIADEIIDRCLIQVGVPVQEVQALLLWGRGQTNFAFQGAIKLLLEKFTQVVDVNGFYDSAQSEIYQRYQQVLPIEGVEEVVAWLKQQSIMTCVASNGSHKKMSLTLPAAGLAKYFRGRVYSADEVDHGKPAPDLFLMAAEKAGVLPSHCIVIEDSIPGMRAAIEAGMQLLAFSPHQQLLPKHEFSQLIQQGAKPFYDMAELLPLLKEMLY